MKTILINNVTDPDEQREMAAEFRKLEKIRPWDMFDFDLCVDCNERVNDKRSMDKSSIEIKTVNSFIRNVVSRHTGYS